MKLLAALCALALTLAAPAMAGDYSLGVLKIRHPWIRTPPASAPTAAGYLSLSNTGAASARLIGAASPVADKVEVHQMSMDGGIMRMRPVTGGLALPPGQTVEISPSGYHLMLIGLKRTLKAGDEVPVTLSFAHAGGVKVMFAVGQGPAATAPSNTMAGMKM